MPFGPTMECMPLPSAIPSPEFGAGPVAKAWARSITKTRTMFIAIPPLCGTAVGLWLAGVSECSARRMRRSGAPRGLKGRCLADAGVAIATEWVCRRVSEVERRGVRV